MLSVHVTVYLVKLVTLDIILVSLIFSGTVTTRSRCKKVKVIHTRLPSMVPELIPVLGSQPAGDVSHKPGGRLPLLSARPAVTPQPLRGLLPVSLLGEQRHNGCEQFA